MKTIIFVLFIIMYFLNTDINGMDFNSNAPNDTVYVCYITDFIYKAGDYYVEISPIQFLWGLDAVIEAKKSGAAEYFVDKVTKDTNWYVSNDYYIVDRKNPVFKIIISGNVKISIYEQAVLKKINLKEMMMNSEYYQIQHYSDEPIGRIGEMVYYPFEIAVENNSVIIIQEMYVP